MHGLNYQISGRGLSAGHVHFDRPAAIPRHAHESAHLVLVYSGRWFDVSDQSLALGAGEILFHPANTHHENRSASGSTELVVAEFDRDFVGAFCALYGGVPRSLRYTFQSFDDVPEKLYEEIIRNDAPSALVVEALLVQLMAVGARGLGPNNSRPEWLARVVAHIHLHAHEPITAAGLADLGAVSLSRLSHGFREHMGKSLSTYIHDYRLRIAARALRQTTRSIKDIALKFGFYDHAHFSREFAKHHGVAPTEYRRQTRIKSLSGAAEAERAKG